MGVTRKVLQNGDGVTFPKPGEELTMHYTGTLMEGGKKFDSSRDKYKPYTFKIGQGKVIKGWDEGVMEMSLGEKAMLFITADYAYGKEAKEGIPANADLCFEVELLAINKIWKKEKAPDYRGAVFERAA